MIINSSSFFRSHWIVWKLLGPAYKQISGGTLYFAYNILFHLLITFGYPLHLTLSVFRNDNPTDDIRNLTFLTTCGACSLKFCIYAYNFDKVVRMEELLKLLDARIRSKAEINIYNQLKNHLKLILYMFIGICVLCAMFSELSFVFQRKRELLYPAWFPFDWLHSTPNFYIAHAYQLLGSCCQLLQNYGNDCFPVVMLCIISAQIKMLYLRFEQVGLSNLQNEAAEAQLEDCITDHKLLLELAHTMESFMSLPMLIQIAVSALNLCISTAGLLFFVTEPFARTYFFFYALAMPLQIFPTCYYGTDNELWFGKLHYAAFSSNWIIQNRSFKKKLMLFVERSLKKNTAMAGGMLRIHVDTFFSALKFAYSLFTIILRMRK